MGECLTATRQVPDDHTDKQRQGDPEEKEYRGEYEEEWGEEKGQEEQDDIEMDTSLTTTSIDRVLSLKTAK